MCYPNHRIEACDCAPMIWFWAPHLCAGLKTAAANLRWCFFGSIKSPRHVNSFTATCALPVHNVIAEGTRHDPTDETHTHMADDRRAGDRHIVGNYRDRYRDRDCSLATNMNRIGSDSYPVLPKLVHPDCRLSERFGSHNIANQRRSLVCALRRETLGSIQPPAPAPRAFNLVGARKHELPGATLLVTL